MLQKLLVDLGLLLVAIVIFVAVLVIAGQVIGPVALVPAAAASLAFLNRFPIRT